MGYSVLGDEGEIVTPRSWYWEILHEDGRPYLLAITLLADIVHWYRPIEERDETGALVGLKKKFEGDLLQRTYNEYAEVYGESKRTIKAALDRLEVLGLIKKHFRTVELAVGESMVKVPNMMYIEIFPKRIGEITYCDGEPFSNDTE